MFELPKLQTSEEIDVMIKTGEEHLAREDLHVFDRLKVEKSIEDLKQLKQVVEEFNKTKRIVKETK